MSIFENTALVRELRNERVSAKFRAAYRYIREFSKKLDIKRTSHLFLFPKYAILGFHEAFYI